ncbi:bleomycin resistance protein [Streptomyces sp. NPDC001822]|uniref:bleomycin resistance protein n=1 Tax=Streptomyces sp. NPDC001822 TaxID=3364614 RepID=UPI00369AC6B8
MSEKCVPILPCRTIDPVLDFYTALGFEVTFRQKSPNPYASVERGGIQLQFFGMKRFDPATSFSTCYVVTDDVDELYASFRAGLKEAYGRVPSSGIPRIGALKDMTYGVRQFLMTDPGGNCVRVGQPTGGDLHHSPAPRETFARALHHASLMADSKEDPAAAAKIIDRVLDSAADAPAPGLLLQLLTLRADVAVRLGDQGGAAALLRRAGSVPLTAGERASLSDTLARLEILRADLLP